ncbi:Scr1 family TA system antitoxin-like transcriptional regulator [Streptomyces sp. NPDC127110]|uniref:Scr1 family TA system antitoxin-like transcriptional regulator n=1 Tax=Streptomyces sp. NPDC127110 TaxID=3345362 RepID=UPI0036336134
MTLSIATPAVHPTAALVVLSAYLATQRERAGVKVGEAARRIHRHATTLAQYEDGTRWIPENELCSLMLLYGRQQRDIRETRQLLHQQTPEEFRDYGICARERARALEARSQRITVFTSWDIPPFLYSEPYRDYQDRHGGVEVLPPRPRPSCPLTLLVDEAVLHRPFGGPAVMAAQLLYWIGLALTGGIKLGVLPLAHGITTHTGVLSEVTMLGGNQIWVDDAAMPIYSTGQAGTSRSACLRYVEAHILDPRDSLQAVREAADRWADKAADSLPRSRRLGTRPKPDPATS